MSISDVVIHNQCPAISWLPYFTLLVTWSLSNYTLVVAILVEWLIWITFFTSYNFTHNLHSFLIRLLLSYLWWQRRSGKGTMYTPWVASDDSLRAWRTISHNSICSFLSPFALFLFALRPILPCSVFFDTYYARWRCVCVCNFVDLTVWRRQICLFESVLECASVKLLCVSSAVAYDIVFHRMRHTLARVY